MADSNEKTTTLPIANAGGNKKTNTEKCEITKHESKSGKMKNTKNGMWMVWWRADERGIMHELCQIQWIECAGWMSGKHWGLLLMIVR